MSTPTGPDEVPTGVSALTLPPTFELRLPEAQLARLEALSGHAVSAIVRVAHQILRGAAGFPGLEALGLEREHVALLRRNLPVEARDILVLGRLDVTTDGEQFASYELNGDQPGGLEYVSLLEDGVAFPPGKGLRPGSPYGAYLEAMLAYFRRHTGRAHPEGVLLLGNRYHLLARLQEALERFFDAPVRCSQLGERCGFDGQRLLYGESAPDHQAVDLVVRSPRVNIYQLSSEPFGAVRDAWLAGRIVLVNPPHSRVAGCKALYPLLRDPSIRDRAGVTDSEADALDRLIPEVVPVDDQSFARIQAERPRWVIKAPLGGKGENVFLGPEQEDAAWSAIVARARRSPGWTASSFRPPFHLPVYVDAAPGSNPVVPVSVDPYVTVGDDFRVAAFLCRAVLPQTSDPAELEHVKLNLLGRNLYTDSQGAERTRVIGLGRVRSR